MSRPSKLSLAQCVRANSLHAQNPKRWSATKLAQKFKVSESSMYNVLNGSYHVRKPNGAAVASAAQLSTVFNRRSTDRMHTSMPDIDMSKLGEPDEVTLAAAQLIVAKSKFAAVLRETIKKH